jgi:Mg2+ and Co2+ transporter CorA
MRLPYSWDLPESITKRFGQRSIGKQRAMIAEGHLLLVLHKVPQPGVKNRQGVFFWRKPDGQWQNSVGGSGIQSLLQHLQSYSQAEEQFTKEYEQAQTVEDYFRILEGIAPLLIATKNLHSTLQDGREGIKEDSDIIDLRDWAYEIERALNLLYENTKNALDLKIARHVEEQTKLTMASVQSGYRLNILAAIFYPLTAVSCVFGMNMVSGFENAGIMTFWMVTGSTVILGIFVRKWVIKGKWLN